MAILDAAEWCGGWVLGRTNLHCGPGGVYGVGDLQQGEFMINPVKWFQLKGFTSNDKITIKDVIDLQSDARRSGMFEAAQILETLPCVNQDGKQSSELIKAAIRQGWSAIIEARNKI